MGRSIVYCDGCGKKLSEQDFDSRRAHTVDDRPFCIDCRPLPAERETPSPRKLSTARIPLATAGGRPSTTRGERKPTAPSKMPLFLGLGAVLLIVILVIALASGGDSKQLPAPERSSAPPPVPRKASKSATDTKPVPKTVGTDRAREVERKMEEEALKTKEARLDAFMADIRKTIAGDRTFERRDEIERMILSALDIAGNRRNEVEKLRAEYARLREEGPAFSGYWKLDGTAGVSKVVDSSMWGRDGTLTEGVTRISGKRGNALRFDGVKGAVTIEKIEGLSPHAGANGELTVCAWVKVPPKARGEEGRSAPIVAKGDTKMWEYALYVSNTGYVSFTVWQLGGSNHVSMPSSTPDLGRWHHLAGVLRKGKFARLYVDGELKVEEKEFKGDTGAGGAPLYFGRRGDGKFFKGDLDDVRIYPRALSDAEIRKIATSE